MFLCTIYYHAFYQCCSIYHGFFTLLLHLSSGFYLNDFFVIPTHWDRTWLYGIAMNLLCLQYWWHCMHDSYVCTMTDKIISPGLLSYVYHLLVYLVSCITKFQLFFLLYISGVINVVTTFAKSIEVYVSFVTQPCVAIRDLYSL